MRDEIDRISKVYAERQQSNTGRDYMWHPCNSMSYAYRHVREKALIELLNRNDIELEHSRILDIGCGSGGLLRFLVSLGGDPRKACGVDILPDRVAKARIVSPPDIHLQVGDARYLAFADQTFDIIGQFTVFSSVLADEYRLAMAGQVNRTLKPGGVLIWYDFITRYPEGSYIQGVNESELARLFPDMELIERVRLHNKLFHKMSRRSWNLAMLADMIPGLPHTHILALLRQT